MTILIGLKFNVKFLYFKLLKHSSLMKYCYESQTFFVLKILLGGKKDKFNINHKLYISKQTILFYYLILNRVFFYYLL